MIKRIKKIIKYQSMKIQTVRYKQMKYKVEMILLIRQELLVVKIIKNLTRIKK